MSQTERVLELLREGPLTPIEALNRVGVFRLAARVSDLKAAGFDIETEIVSNGRKHFARYHLRETPQRSLGL